MLVKVEGGRYVKDTKTNAVLTVDKSVLLQNEARKKLSQSLNSKGEDIQKVKTEVESLKNDISEIKELLKQIINR